MSFSLTLPKALADQHWRVKIFDQERLEEPHVSIVTKNTIWRFSLRRLDFMDPEPDRGDVPPALIACIKASKDVLFRQWDSMYPLNPVMSSPAAKTPRSGPFTKKRRGRKTKG